MPKPIPSWVLILRLGHIGDRGISGECPGGLDGQSGKLMFIKPTLVGKGLFMGDLSNTKTTYEIRSTRTA